ncbi:hypothetical protein ACFYO1_29540 [Nocardia sp. NPDC006044]|uniref:hypothetical protein n=1 Tax=Nocardia sp. NPDC006044 TaxID=3364306 RepID=UPI00369682C9
MTTVDVFRSEPGQIKNIVVRIVGGNIRLSYSKRDIIAVRAEGDTATLGANAAVHGDTLHIGSSSTLRYFAQRARIDLIIDCPEEISVSIKALGTNLVVDGGTGPLHVDCFAGAVEGTTYSDDVRVKIKIGSNDLVRRQR